jgi:AcrR family transcriptional regulator
MSNARPGTQVLRRPGLGLAGAKMIAGHHICGLFETRPEADGSLVPFLLDGLTRGERIVRVVSAAERENSLAALLEAGVDVGSAIAADRLKVEVWEQTYLSGGRFDGTAMLSRILEILGEGQSLGFGRTLYVADMAWAHRHHVPARDVVAYEARVDRALRKLPDIVICCYDLQQFGTAQVVDVLAAHAWALVGGVLKPSRGTEPRASARDRILEASDGLFSARGIQATSIDAVIAVADVAKATVYRHFPSKDDLIVGWLRDERPRWFDRVRAVAEARAGADPATIPGALFDAIAEWLIADEFRGCPFLNATAEIPDPAHPARAVIREYLADMQGQLESMLRLAGVPEARELAAQFQILILGSVILGAGRRSTDPVTDAREAAERLLEQPARAR